MFNIVLYISAASLLAVSFFKDRGKTKAALKKAAKSFENILPQLLTLLCVIGIMLSVLNRETISLLLGNNSGLIGILIAAAIGSVTLIPGFISYPLAASLYRAGAGVAQIAAFLSTLMMVGVVTFPLETKYFGKKAAVLRNLLALVYSFALAFLMGGILG